MVAARLERIVHYVRRWRPVGEATESLTVSVDLPEADLRRLRRLIDESIDGRGGEVAARRKARLIGTTFSTLNTVGRRRFFEVLATDYDGDDTEVDRAIDTVLRAGDQNQRRQAEAELRQALVPRRERLLRRFAGLDGGLPFLVTLREDLLSHLSSDPSLATVDNDLKPILAGWFDVALLRLERLTWDSPAALLEKLIEYEAVHAIESWDDLKGRLGAGRRCYAFLHPEMPDDPLIFVEVALTKGVATSLPDLLDHEAERTEAIDADTAIFYSISNCQQGLAGVSLGDFLIKSVAEELSIDLPNVKTFATLSPLPGFRRWVTQAIANHDIALTPIEARRLAPDDPARAETAFAELVAGPVPATEQTFLNQAKPILMRLAADYLVNHRLGLRALDPVAHFHLSNGASIDQLNWWANPSAAGWERGLGMMVNYRYELRSIERNHDRYVGDGELSASDGVRRFLDAIEGDPPD
ncbi:MAG: malonyl-CoA decarboxylase [Actinomycetia bacterium]|nr:malonyl-CoA decarboxylase [Actinomycetes bacterium]